MPEDILSQHNFRYSGTSLHIERASLRDIAERFGTPLYVYSKRQILENFRAFSATLAQADARHVVAYAVKANANPAILKLLAEEGAQAEVVSGGELLAALAAGFAPEKISFDGVGKTDEEIALALRENIATFTVESDQELEVISQLATEAGKTASVAIRVNPDVDAKAHPYISTGMKENKFGVDIDTAVETFKLAKSLPNIRIVGLHAHIGSQITSIDPFVEAAHSLLHFTKRLDRIGITLEYIDFGGGQGIRYHNVVRHELLPSCEEDEHEYYPSLEEFVQAVVPIFSKTGLALVIEPGRAIVANSCALLTKVLYTKASEAKKFVIVDAGMSELIRPCLYQAYHQAVPLELKRSPVETVDIVGPICETSDFLALGRKLPSMKRGDYLAIMCAGAYGYSLASNYNMRPRSAEVLVDGDECTLVRPRERVEDLIFKE